MLRRDKRYQIKNAMLDASHGKVSIEDFELLKVLGTGAYGKVFLVRRKGGNGNGKLFAMKVLKKSAVVAKAKTTEHTITERNVLEAVRRCPFIVTMHYAFQTEAKLHIIMDYVSGGELFTHLYNRAHFTENEAKFYTAEVVIALEFLHKLGVIYRDIKLENILLDGDGHIVLTDFGLSKEFHHLHENVDERAYSFCGTIEYMAPEIVNGDKNGHGMAVDWWSLGVLFYELVTGASPFTVEGEQNSQREISWRILNIDPPMPKVISKFAQDFIWRLLQKNPAKRLGNGPNNVTEIKRHPLFFGIDWDLLSRKELAPPFKPIVKDDTDTSNFSEEFTKLMPVDSPAVVPKNADKVFRGYSFVAPSIIFGKNSFADELFLSEANQPVDNLIYRNLFEASSFHKEYLLSHDILGKGSFSICKKCIKRSTNNEYAVKIMTKRFDHSCEVQSLRLCQNHPNVVQLHEIHEDEFHIYLVMEFLRGGELLDRIKKKTTFSESEACSIMRKLVSVVSFMHNVGVVHRDLKPENILFADSSDPAELKLVDFGFARIHGNNPLQTPCFTLTYAAPEILRNATSNQTATYDNSVDIWSLGVILYTMLSGKVPFQPKNYTNESVISMIKRIMSGNISFDSYEWHGVSTSAKHLIKGLLMVDPSKRLTINDILQHEWLTGRVDVPSTPLLTPGVLGSSRNQIEKAFKVALNAFHKVHTVTLMDVASAPLAKRRKLKHSNENSSPGSSSGSDKERSLDDIPICMNKEISCKRKIQQHESSCKKAKQEINENLHHKFDKESLMVFSTSDSKTACNFSDETENFQSQYSHSSDFHL
ncbi:ribosomal protein S6 kinase alpha-5 isoform X1 [Hydra vulgaris]|uniref:ribosomal protein S6 kinase alpha-5 isoform X1 n=1 Tax=Hydra vulgaris TaxID=6087 RepID=UPI001F5E8864|nr:ribosomal protein S6 kinase alpha-5 isoform X1 [Hydra vulgaris]